MDIVLTTNVEFNQDGSDGRVRAAVYEDTGGGTNSANVNVSEGWDSNVLSGFDGDNGTNEYAVRFALYNENEPTQSPVIHQATIDVPTVTKVVTVSPTSASTTTFESTFQSETTLEATSTQSSASPHTTTETSETTVSASLTSTSVAPSTVTQTYSDVVFGTSVTDGTAIPHADETAASTLGSTVTDTVASPQTVYEWAAITRESSPTSATATPTFDIQTEYNEIAVYEQRIGANIDHIEDSWSNRAIPFGRNAHREPNIYKLSRALTGVLDGFDYRTNVVHTNIHVPYATGPSLDRIGNLANVSRKTGESDARYRKRIIVTMRASVTGTTYDEVAEITAELLDTDVMNVTFDFRRQEFPATLFVIVDEGDMDTTPFTAEEIADLLDRCVPADHDVVLELQGTFLFKDVGEADESEHGFTTTPADESVGGTLKGEIGQ